jgi:integrase
VAKSTERVVKTYDDLERHRKDKKMRDGQLARDYYVDGLGYIKQGERMFGRARVMRAGKRVMKSWPMPTYEALLSQAVAAGRAAPGAKRCADAEDHLERVRAEARAFRNSLKLGTTPLAPTTAPAAEDHTVVELAKQFAAVHFPKVKEKSAKTMRAHLDRYILPLLGTRAVASVTRQDIAMMHAGLGKTPFQANRVLSTARQLFGLAVEWSWRETNPATGITPFAEPERERWLSDDELARLGAALDAHGDNPSAQAIKMLALTGARKSEVLGAKWTEFDGLDGDKPTWTIPAIRTKKAKSIVRHLDPVMVALVKSIKREGAYLFPSPADPKKPLKDVKRFWQTVKKEAGIVEEEGQEPVVLHSLRHTVASHIVSDGGELLTARDQLGQSSLKSTQRYATLAPGKMRETMTEFGKKLGNGNGAHK